MQYCSLTCYYKLSKGFIGIFSVLGDIYGTFLCHLSNVLKMTLLDVNTGAFQP